MLWGKYGKGGGDLSKIQLMASNMKLPEQASGAEMSIFRDISFSQITTIKYM
jgi:hypothetical protein